MLLIHVLKIGNVLRRYITKSFFTGLLILFLINMCPTSVYAHPPKDMKLNYDFVKQTVTVTITHSVLAPTMHYIKTVEIKSKVKVLVKQEYNSQPDQEVFTYTYNIPIGDDDILEVTATCNVFGSKTVTLPIAAPAKK